MYSSTLTEVNRQPKAICGGPHQLESVLMSNTYSLVYYPINNNQWTFCNMTAIGASYLASLVLVWEENGGELIASLNISAGGACPTGWNKSSMNDASFCRSPSNNIGCYSTTFSTTRVSYQRVCGRARGYQKGKTDEFLAGGNIDGSYVNGLSITHGSPHQHIWT